MGLTASVIGGYVYSGTPSLGPYQLESGQGANTTELLGELSLNWGAGDLLWGSCTAQRQVLQGLFSIEPPDTSLNHERSSL